MAGLAASKITMLTTMLCVKAANAGEETAIYSPILKQQVYEEDYTLDQIYNFDENGLH